MVVSDRHDVVIAVGLLANSLIGVLADTLLGLLGTDRKTVLVLRQEGGGNLHTGLLGL